MSHTVKAFFVAAGLFCLTLLSVPPASAAGSPAEGKKIFESICVNCHGPEGVTEIPGIPVFSNGERIGKPEDQLKKSITNGVNNPDNPAGMSMPPFGGGPPLNDKQLSDVISYIKTLKK